MAYICDSLVLTSVIIGTSVIICSWKHGVTVIVRPVAWTVYYYYLFMLSLLLLVLSLSLLSWIVRAVISLIEARGQSMPLPWHNELSFPHVQ